MIRVKEVVPWLQVVSWTQQERKDKNWRCAMCMRMAPLRIKSTGQSQGHPKTQRCVILITWWSWDRFGHLVRDAHGTTNCLKRECSFGCKREYNRCDRNWKQVWSSFSSCVAFKPTVSLLLLHPSFVVHVYGCSWFSFSIAVSVDSCVLRLDFKWQYENPTFHHCTCFTKGIRQDRRESIYLLSDLRFSTLSPCVEYNVSMWKLYPWIKFDLLSGVYQVLSSPSDRLRILCGDFNTPQAEKPNGEIITWGYTKGNDRYFLTRSGQYQHELEMSILR